jgi:arginine:pyruvate transaminase
MTAQAIVDGSPVSAGMAQRFASRAQLLRDRLDGVAGMRVHLPDAGMFALVDVGAVAADGQAFALALLENAGVAVMPGASFGVALRSWLRLSLTQPDEVIEEACRRIAAYAAEYKP